MEGKTPRTPQDGASPARRSRAGTSTKRPTGRTRSADPASSRKGQGGFDAAAFAADGMDAPEELMENFSRNRMGRGLGISIMAHLVVVTLFSMGYLGAMLLGGNDEDSDPEARAARAAEEAQASVRAIAARHGVPVSELTRVLAPTIPDAPPPSPTPTPTPDAGTDPAPSADDAVPPPARPLMPVEERIQDAAAPGDVPIRPETMDDLLEGM